MSDDDVKQQALEQAQQAYGLFIWFVKWFSYVMIFMIVLMLVVLRHHHSYCSPTHLTISPVFHLAHSFCASS